MVIAMEDRSVEMSRSMAMTKEVDWSDEEARRACSKDLSRLD